ncbi:Integral membrane protein [Collimonas fungivorans Ter331]|uniref:Integral membrane protein n=1 Tax=Collimonas fungivorans (strain Ter331) TaxID=1005048 RepID=G0ADG0_COLFT|nr:Integral membrane protein [Collimonas fungivorans Ter331]
MQHRIFPAHPSDLFPGDANLSRQTPHRALPTIASSTHWICGWQCGRPSISAGTAALEVRGSDCRDDDACVLSPCERNPMLLQNFKIPLSLTLLALLIAYLMGGVEDMLIVAILLVLEISLSLDNAVVNASVLKNWSKKWQDRFMTYGLPVAVFGMRFIFPLLIVAILANMDFWSALTLALESPAQYAAILQSAHHQVAAFGGAFLLMVFFQFMLDRDKEAHWLGWLEAPLAWLGRVAAIDVALTLGVVVLASYQVAAAEQVAFLLAGIAGVIGFVVAHGIGSLLGDGSGDRVVREGAAGFLYLEVLDASFSFDGVIGAFALSNNIVVIALGLGVGAAYIRSMTLVLLRKNTLVEYKYLEHGAFWAIGVLGAIMFVNVSYHVPAVVTGLAGAALIGLAIVSSMIARKNDEKCAVA